MSYRVEFHSVDSPFQLLRFLMEISQESEPMTSQEGKRYASFLPVEETKTIKSMLPQNATNVIIESEQRIAPKEPDELLEVLKDECFYRHEGWWSYEFCCHGKIRHVHVEGEKVRFVCSEPTVLISSIKEISSCKYVVTVHSPMLCRNPLFQQEKHTFSIHFNELPTETESNIEADSLPKEAQISII